MVLQSFSLLPHSVPMWPGNIGSKREAKEAVHLFNQAENLVTKNMEMVKGLCTLFVLAFPRKVCPQASHVLDSSRRVWEWSVSHRRAEEHPSQWDMCKSMGSDGMDVSMSAEIAGWWHREATVIFEKSCGGDSWRQAAHPPSRREKPGTSCESMWRWWSNLHIQACER